MQRLLVTTAAFLAIAATVPANATNMVAIAANYKVSMGLRNDGTVLEWGAVTNFLAPVPSGLANVVAIFLVRLVGKNLDA